MIQRAVMVMAVFSLTPTVMQLHLVSPIISPFIMSAKVWVLSASEVFRRKPFHPQTPNVNLIELARRQAPCVALVMAVLSTPLTPLTLIKLTIPKCLRTLLKHSALTVFQSTVRANPSPLRAWRLTRSLQAFHMQVKSRIGLHCKLTIRKPALRRGNAPLRASGDIYKKKEGQ